MQRRLLILSPILSSLVLLASACADDVTTNPTGTESGTDETGDGDPGDGDPGDGDPGDGDPGDGDGDVDPIGECGDGIVDAQVGEECDDGGESETCDADCTYVECGDAELNATAGEICDDGGESATCNDDCTAAACGDSVTNMSAGEDCDDGQNGDQDDGCTDLCLAPFCGDAYQQAGEDCDDGNGQNADGCNNNCTVSGSLAWSDIHDNDGGNDVAYGVAVDSMGNVAVVGRISVNGARVDAWVRKYDPDGNIMWSNVYNAGEGNDYGYAIAIDSNDDIIIGGRQSGTNQGGNTWVHKMDGSGTMIWEQTWNSQYDGNEWVRGISVDSQDAVIAAGRSWAPGEGYNVWVRKYDADGAEGWTQQYLGPDNSADYGNAVATDSEDNVIVGGETWVANEGPNTWLRKYADDGTELWSDSVNNDDSDDIINGVAVDLDDNILVSGSAWITNQSHDVWVRKYDPDGNALWTYTLDGAASSDDRGRAVAVDSTNAVVFAGQSWVMDQASNMILQKHEADGNELWTASYDGAAHLNDAGYGVATTPDDGIVVVGVTANDDITNDILIRKYNP